MLIKLDVDDIANRVAERIVECLEFPLMRKIYPKELKGNRAAGDLVGATSAAMAERCKRGVYQEGKHYWKKSDRIIMWDRDALLDTLKEKDNGKSQTILQSK